MGKVSSTDGTQIAYDKQGTYSHDVRQCILRAFDQGKPRAEIIKTSMVSRSRIKRYLRMRREIRIVAISSPPGSGSADALGWQITSAEARRPLLDALLHILHPSCGFGRGPHRF